MLASEVRRRVLLDHSGLRSRLSELETLVDQARRGDESIVDGLRHKTESMLAFLRTHMDWEEQYLGAALREADAWGDERFARLQRDHADQRELLGFAADRLRDGQRPTSLLVMDLASLIELIRADMTEEENDLLTTAILRDDVVAIDAECG